MQTWHLFILGYVALMSVGQYLGKVFVHRVHAYQVLFYQYIASLITVSIYILLLKPESNFFDVPIWLIVIGFLYGIGISSYYRAKKQSLSKSKVVSNLAGVVTIILAVIFLGEWQMLSLDQWGGISKIIGIVLAFLALFSFYKQRTHVGSEETFNYKIWVKWITVYIFIMGFAFFLVKYSVASSEPLLVLRLQYIGSFLIIAILCLVTQKSLLIGWKNILGCMLIGVVISSSLAALYTALSLSSATQVMSISAVVLSIIVAIIGIFSFKEKITRRMILPFIIGLVAIYLLK